eukprot:tig00000037_g10087.t1
MGEKGECGNRSEEELSAAHRLDAMSGLLEFFRADDTPDPNILEDLETIDKKIHKIIKKRSKKLEKWINAENELARAWTGHTSQSGTIFKVALCADMDAAAVKKGLFSTDFTSVIKNLDLFRDNNGHYHLFHTDIRQLFVKESFKGRGAELSELVVFNNSLLTVDDRTGLVYAIEGERLVKKAELGLVENLPFKAEWATVKDGRLYIGSHGNVKEKRTLPVKVVHPDWTVTTEDWTPRYKKLMAAAGAPNGNCVYEGAVWHPQRKRWIFLPRKIVADSSIPWSMSSFMGANVLQEATENFESVTQRTLPLAAEPSRTFSSVKIVPGFEQELVALKTIEFDTECATYLTVFTVDGHVLLPETYIASDKYEGLAVLASERSGAPFAPHGPSAPYSPSSPALQGSSSSRSPGPGRATSPFVPAYAPGAPTTYSAPLVDARIQEAVDKARRKVDEATKMYCSAKLCTTRTMEALKAIKL